MANEVVMRTAITQRAYKPLPLPSRYCRIWNTACMISKRMLKEPKMLTLHRASQSSSHVSPFFIEA
jgi:hypothetical protein